MPRGRMQHTAALPHGKSLLGICRQCDRVHVKKELFAHLLQVTKPVEQDR